MVLGLTGGIATGKSTVSDLFKGFNIPIIDADLVAREVVEPGTKGLKQIQSTFGWQMIQPDGTLDRHALGTLVFSQPEALAQLNDITGPLIKKAVIRKLQGYRRRKAPLVIYDAPTLFEARGASGVNEIMVVTLPAELQLERLMARDQLSQDEALERINAQLPLAEKAKRADIVIDNSQTVDKTKAQVVRWLNEAGFGSLITTKANQVKK
ncbi:dephospho-CoA kinase [Lactobacillus sp. LC28-10]|uniref:Dephospho-CoA kinase n=1 Tax=Secundilactobacillus angelensis TaxID=2722706 RepID=A0ABX1KXZ9_9LACO|nr:dephospho-CoA kinase [Secundilactobacillus angelensis]MCH5462711.1 dephospho-CoA kinase [Secundilactobacillus angelensis]NLR18823.1 dephospho-CoA kinase [Secundilactobacillus angelensis]